MQSRNFATFQADMDHEEVKTMKTGSDTYVNYWTLEELLQGLTLVRRPENWEELKTLKVHAVQRDSRLIEAGDVFVAVPGYETDGHLYVMAAAQKGALCALVEKPREDCSLPQIVVSNSRQALSHLACNYYAHPSHELNLCGITGSNGKTSTSLMYRSILEAAGRDCGLVGTVAYHTGKSFVSSKLTTPDSLDLQRYLREMVDSGYKDAVMEVSSIGQSEYRNAGCLYREASLLNLGREHLDFHGSMENYFAAKKPLIMGLKPEATAVLNADDPWSYSLLNETKARVLTFGLKEEADLRAIKPDLSSGYAHTELVYKPLRRSAASPEGESEERAKLVLAVPGIHSLMNALAAVGLALAAGLPLSTCVHGIESFHGVERRFQQIYDGKFRIFDDHFANAGNIRMTLETLCHMTYEQLVLLYAIRGNRGVTVNAENIDALADYLPRLRLKKFIATLSRDTTGHYDKVSDEEIAVFKREMAEQGQSYTLKEQLEEAVQEALACCGKGDVLLLAGCQGMDAGARLALGELAGQYPDEREKILWPLKDRVCGWPE